MEETLELRVTGEHFSKVFAKGEGEKLGEGRVYKVLVSTSDPRLRKIAAFSHAFRLKFFAGWKYHRHYTVAELQTAELLQLEIQKVFEPVGIDCGMAYDESSACTICGAGRTQTSLLRLDLRRATKSKDLARTFAPEWIVSQRLAEVITDHKITGCELTPIEHRSDPQLPPVDLRFHPAGQEVMEMAAAAGAPYPTWGVLGVVESSRTGGASRRVAKDGTFKTARYSKTPEVVSNPAIHSCESLDARGIESIWHRPIRRRRGGGVPVPARTYPRPQSPLRADDSPAAVRRHGGLRRH
jgi:hypothetical protein